MNNNDINKQRLIDTLLSSSGGKLSRDSISRAADGKDITPLVNSLSPEDREKLPLMAALWESGRGERLGLEFT